MPTGRCARARERRDELGLAHQRMGELIRVTYQQVHRYDGLNRISAGRLYRIAQALGVEISDFFAGVEPERCNAELNTRHGVLQKRAVLGHGHSCGFVVRGPYRGRRWPAG